MNIFYKSIVLYNYEFFLYKCKILQKLMIFNEIIFKYKL